MAESREVRLFRDSNAFSHLGIAASPMRMRNESAVSQLTLFATHPIVIVTRNGADGVRLAIGLSAFHYVRHDPKY
jgi:hypothetical protein